MSEQKSELEFKDPFPFKRVISLAPLAEFWSNLAGDDSAPSFSIAKNVVSRIREVPEFQATSVSLEAIEQHADLLELMMTAVFPAARLDRIIAAAFFPFELKSIYATAGFKKLGILDKFLNHNNIRGCCLSVEDMLKGKAMSAYHAIVSVHYGMNIPFAIPFVIQSLNESTGLNRYYRVSIDPTFVRIQVCGSLPELKPEDRKRLMAEPMNLELWSEILPPEHFEFHGFAVMSAVEVTDQEVLSRLKNDLLLKDAMTSAGSVRSLERHLQELFSRPDVRLGLIALDRWCAAHVSNARPIAQSLLLSDGHPECPDWKNSYYTRVIETGSHIFVDDLNEESDLTGFEKHLQEKGLRSLFIGPLKVRDEVIGIIELASTNVSDI
ncbi:MAG: hypothetical protein IIA50_00100, partial [Bacteroidetes bacterium]|nr:hypothetical protein [Bacteroidota bacterium]